MATERCLFLTLALLPIVLAGCSEPTGGGSTPGAPPPAIPSGPGTATTAPTRSPEPMATQTVAPTVPAASLSSDTPGTGESPYATGEKCGTVFVGPAKTPVDVYVERGSDTCAEAVATVEDYLDSSSQGGGNTLYLELANGIGCSMPTAARSTATGNVLVCETPDQSTRIVGRSADSYALDGPRADPAQFATGNALTPYKFITADGNTECSTSNESEVDVFCITGRSSGGLQYGSIGPEMNPAGGPFKYEPGMPVFNGEGAVLPVGQVFATEGVTCRAEDATTVRCTSPSGEVVLDGRSVRVS